MAHLVRDHEDMNRIAKFARSVLLMLILRALRADSCGSKIVYETGSILSLGEIS